MEKTIISQEYKSWLQELKLQIKRTQIKASISVNSQLIMLYWDLGRQITEKQDEAKWGSGFLERLSKDLKAEFPEMTGFSVTNLKYCKYFYNFYSEEDEILTITPIRHQLGDESQIINKQTNIIRHQLGDELTGNKLLMIPWRHHVVIINKIKNIPEAVFYINKTIENSWSRAVLEYHIQSNLYKTLGKAKTNFKYTLPEPESDLAIEHVKSEYNFEFLQMYDKAKESELEKGLLNHIRDFLLELGKGFAYMGSQYPVKVGSKEYKIDLLFYHAILSCYVVIELKVKEFEPEHTGKLGFYVSAVDKYIKKPKDNPTIGILLCMEKDDEVVDLSLQSINSPVGVSIFRYKELTEETKALLPTEEELQNELENFEKDRLIKDK